jgi:hypothetical protein
MPTHTVLNTVLSVPTKPAVVGLETACGITLAALTLRYSADIKSTAHHRSILCDQQTMENGAPSQPDGKDPSGFLSQIIGSPVTVKLNSGVVYKGKYLSCIPPLCCDS